MPPKGKASKLHVLAAEIPVGFKFVDTNKKEFVLGKQFATGGFGRIYTCTEAGKKEQLCVKVEPSGNGPLFVEIAVFQRALKLEMIQAYCKEKKLKSVGLPHMISGGIFDYKEDKMRFLVMPKYAGSLEAVREKTGSLDAAAAITVAKANVRSLEYLASKNYTHGDIKSMNILLPSPTDFEGAVLVDFGLARMASSNVEKADKKRAHNGTAIFTSLDAHRGFQPSYRGDVEILVYNIVYWITGTLPWQKEVWEKSAEKEIERLIGSAIGGPVAKIYRIAQKTPYTEFVDTVAVLKDINTPKIEPKPSTSKRVATKKKIVVEESDEEEEEEVIPKSTSRRVRKPVIDSEESTPVKLTKRTTVPKRAGSELMEASSTTASREDRVRKRTASVEPAALSSPTRKPTDPKQRRPIPGLVNRVVKKVEEEVEDEEMKKEEKSADAKPRRPIPGLANRVVKKIVEEDEDDEGKAMRASQSEEDEEEEDKPKGVGSAVKANKEELRRMVPGMRNLEKGRRSEIISQIVRKHKK
ncbi:vrk-1 [Pristionchus pacificus]|uniref:Vrk-1 n=1 Tax=Pristionchus pacificus TaxID=54126 RepID=A0A2A6B8M3_PRIPA|nr:vrk-1 [Pristionchus pacificus]|eukprot:PDM62221.1 vrk-1 [Pristionchus pacificus]